MSAILIPPIPETFVKADAMKGFFDDLEERDIRKKHEVREQPILGVPGESCKTNLFFGFFFDGTKNNYVQAEAGQNHSNVARLYDCYPGLSVPGVLPASTDWTYNAARYQHFFKVYVPGVASPFKEINDSGTGLELTRGAAMGYRGESRIIWGLLQAINNVHRYFLKTPLLSPSETLSLVYRLDMTKEHRRYMGKQSQRAGLFSRSDRNEEKDEKTRLEFEKVLKRLHAAVKQHWPDKKTGKPAKIDPAQVKKIYISIFGFSRGATQARAFTNWLMAVCRLDAKLAGRTGMSLGGFDVQFDFLGLFDTVASVGAGNTMGNSILGRFFDGHGGWADAEESLRIPEGIRCVHLVAAHEIRRSFPLDSISVGQTTPPNSEEIVLPGVHSDIGCGYCPLEQGRGTDPSGADMLTRVPLLYMYREARLAGVPLKLELASPAVKKKFKIMPSTIKALNSYLANCQVKSGTLTAIMREQAKNHILYHKTRRPTGKMPLESTASFGRATNFDKNDLHSANLELEAEIGKFEEWLKEEGKGFKPRAQEPGFDNEHKSEWEEIATWWSSAPPVPQTTLDFFDNYVHDSRAWFKLTGDYPDNEPELEENLKKWAAQLRRVAEYNERKAKAAALNEERMTKLYGKNSGMQQPPFVPMKDNLDDNKRQAALEYDRTGKIPRMKTDGREPYESWGLSPLAGYLRFRKVYAGRDSVLISEVHQEEDKQVA
ncbi:Uncharacterized alpha/beta hydrolase domain [Duganella sacchari]|uniref:Uncharacterized alpha/beta hydrolase domain n=1 Tax=Duganella sacchari TaxID=551987 RepID=A0A1M7P3I2_9BURK|nr:DUF2235 domain-containing protein [Duganella sacchari]SHN11120.1 Uncharacterized alpha/beta hydrolase domain [Duganella sacchari]